MMRPPRHPGVNRSDYLAVFEAEGAPGLNRLLRERYADPKVLARELQLMEKRGLWKIEWADDGEGLVIGPLHGKRRPLSA